MQLPATQTMHATNPRNKQTQQTNNQKSRNPKNDNGFRQQCPLELETDDLMKLFNSNGQNDISVGPL